jgi:Helix-turn-helix domain
MTAPGSTGTQGAERTYPAQAGPPGRKDPAGDPYLTVADLARYAGVAERTIRSYLVSPPLPRATGPVPPPLPHYRLGRRVLIRRSEFDRWMAAYRARPTEARELVERLGRMAS